MAGILQDGYSTILSFSLKSTVKFREKEVTPSGVSVGSIDTTTMRNTAWRTKNPKTLRTLEDTSAVVAYDPTVFGDIMTMLGIVQTVTIHYPDGQIQAFRGWLDEFKPNRMVEGTQPTAEVKIIAANTTLPAETAPTLPGVA